MSCKYIYKGHTFNSETEFDDFLIEKQLFESVLGDIVFSMSTPLAGTMALLKDFRKKSEEIKSQSRKYRENHKTVYDEDGEEMFDDPPYQGVNAFLAHTRNSDNKRLFPEFIEDEYWKRRWDDWKKGIYNDVELEVFGFDKNNPPKITDEKELKKRRDEIKFKWENQARSGTAVHSILQMIFTKPKGKTRYMFENSKEFLFDWIKKEINKEHRPFINDQVIKDTIDYAFKLRDDLKKHFNDENLQFYPEFGITARVQRPGKDPVELLGVIDLLIIDSDGRAHILDYKTSIHSYGEFGSAKELTYQYQLATYQRMLLNYGINTKEGQLFVAPIQLTNFRKEGLKYTYDTIKYTSPFKNLTSLMTSLKMWDNIEEFLPEVYEANITGNNVGTNVSDMMAKWFPKYQSERKIDELTVIKELKAHNLLKRNDEGKFVYNRYWAHKPPIIESDEGKFVLEVLKFKLSERRARDKYTETVKIGIKQAFLKGIDRAEFPTPTSKTGSTTWLKDSISKYCDGNWEVKNVPEAEAYGIIVLETIKNPEVAPQIDFIKVTTNTLHYNQQLRVSKADPEYQAYRNRSGLTAAFEEDIAEQSKSGSLMLQGVNGNVESIETMLVINSLAGVQGKTIGGITVINPTLNNGMQASNEELLYCWKALNHYSKVLNDNFLSGKYLFASKYEIVKQTLNHILAKGHRDSFEGESYHARELVDAKSELDKNIIDTSDQVRALENLLKTMLKDLYIVDRISYPTSDMSRLKNEYVLLYNLTLTAIAYLKGVNFRQQLEDHDKYLENAMIFSKGVSGSFIDNPGNLSSQTLNLVTTLVKQAYLNTRDDMQRERGKILKLVERLRKDKGISYLGAHSVTNLVSLYEKMTTVIKDGDGNIVDWLFVDPNKAGLSAAEKEFLKYALDKINHNRLPNASDEELERMRLNNDPRYFRVPLSRGGSDTIASVRGLNNALSDKLKSFLPQEAWKRAREKLEGVFNAEESLEAQKNLLLLYEMTNTFDKGEQDDYRGEMFSGEDAKPIEYFEHNLETLLYRHLHAYSTKKNIDGVFPMIKAAMVHIKNQAAIGNTEFKEDSEYLDSYVRSKILNQSIIDPKRKKIAAYLGQIKRAASLFTLALSPVLALYQPLQGLWNVIRLYIQKPDGTLAFSRKNLTDAIRIVYSDLTHFSDRPTITSLCNETYGMNDMDMNVYADRLSSGQHGIWDFTNFLYKFASRPDYYNRMIIFTALMLGDGCYLAHSIDNNGNLKYDWTKDERFKEFAANPTGKSELINIQRSMYYSVARLFVAEHAKNPDGTDFVLDMNNPLPLPRAYASQQVEGYKSLADDIYGYYTHENKSLIMNSIIGAMWLLFKTYWSGKKNQYLLKGGIYQRGKWAARKEVDENGVEHFFYYLIDAEGNPEYNKPPLRDDDPNLKAKAAIVILWQGQWQEGIMVTLADMVKLMWNEKSISKGFRNKWGNEDPTELLQVYRANVKQFGYDLFMFAILGPLLGALLADMLKDLKSGIGENPSLLDTIALGAANIGVLSVTNSFMDFNAIDSVGSPIKSWTPFAFDWGGRQIANVYSVAVGDRDIWDGLVNTFSATKTIKPALDTIKPDWINYTKSK